MSKSYDDDVRERELDAAIKAALAKGDHKLADALVEQYEPPKSAPEGIAL